MRYFSLVARFFFILFCFNKEILISQNKETETSLLSKLASVSNLQKDSILISIYDSALKMHENQNQTDALREALVLFEVCDKLDKKHLKYQTSNLIADIYKRSYDYNKSIKYYKISLSILKSQKNTTFKEKENNNANNDLLTEFAYIYLQIGSVYQRLQMEIETINEEEKNIIKVKLNKYKDSSIFYYKKLEEINSFNQNILKYKADSYHNLSAIYQRDSLLDKAKELILKSIEIYKFKNDDIKLAGSYNNLGNIFLLEKQYVLAKNEYYKGTELIKDNKDPKAVKTLAKLYYNIAWSMYKLKDYKAYDYQELSYGIQDKERENSVRKMIAQITANHKESLEKQKVDLVKNQIELEKQQKRASNYLFGAITLLTLVISGIVLYNYKLRQKNLQLKLTQSKLIEKQNIDRIKSESQVKILNATIDGKESERKQIAETLHDSVSALLSSANMHLSATKKQFNGSTPIELDKTQEIILEAAEKVRDLSHTLVSSILLKFGLEYALKDIAKKYSNTELSFHTEFTNVSRYSQEFEIKIYNVIHELINNILKHSKASNAYIVIEDKNDFLSILIEDDGIGFNYKYSNEKTGLGLNQIEARIQMMNGNFLIESSENRGAKITISVPVQKKIAFNYA